MAASGVLRSAQQVLKFLVEGRGFDRVLSNVRNHESTELGFDSASCGKVDMQIIIRLRRYEC